MPIELRPYQTQVKRETYWWFRSNKNVLIYAATGAGKAIMIAQMVLDALTKGKRSLVVVHRKKLVGQLEETIKWVCEYTPSIIKPGGDYNPRNLVQVAMAQTLQNRDLPPDVDLLIGDEIHITAYMKVWTDCLNQYCAPIWSLSKTRVVGLSGSPWRTKYKEGFCQFFDRVVKAPPPRELIEMGFLTNPVLYTYDMVQLASLELDDDGTEYSLSSLQRACTNEYNADVITNWENLAKDRKTIFFCVSVKQAEGMTQQLVSLGYKTELITGTTSKTKANTIFDNFKHDKTQILVSIGTLTEGFDDPSIGAVVIARPTRSLCLFTQMVGRGLRIKEGKKDVYILDCGGCIGWLTSKRFGGKLYDDPINITYVSLCPRTNFTPVIETKDCWNCGAEIKRWLRVCPECGHIFPVKEKGEKIKPEDVTFPELVSYFTKEGSKQYSFIRRHLMRAFRQRYSPQKALKSFHKKYQIIPPKDFCLGAIFGMKNVESSMALYKASLESLGMPTLQIEYYLQLEFGEFGRDYVIAGVPYRRPTLGLTFDPWQYLGIEQGSDEVAIKAAYQKLAVVTDNTITLNTAFELCKEG